MTRTFLFTDIESSTRLWEAYPGTMPGALARHDSILQAAVGDAGGRVLKATGDGMLAVFDSPRQAVAAGARAQLDVDAEKWETGEPLRVRMGIHVGEAEERDDDFFGPTLNRTARIMAAAHGGQVLLSHTAAAWVRDQLEGDLVLRDMGTHRLKDLTEPEHIFQLVATGSPSDFPPLRTLDSTPNNLPFQSAEFFGREQEIEGVVQLLDDPSIRLVTLFGPGGTGKTRLATQAAAERAHDFDDGVFFVDLSAEREAMAAFEAVVRVLDVPVGGEGDPLAALKARLRDKHLLLVLDNVEQVVESASGLVELLEHCRHLVVLVTSREALRVRAEHIFPVPPMSLPAPGASTEEIASAEAVMLFVERARAIRPDFSLTSENAQAVAAICARLDGLPLAIELAAARLNVFSAADLLRRIDERMDVLATRGRDRPERQQTLWGAIGWSYDLLDERDRRMVELMSVFSGASLEALEAVSSAADPEIDAVEALASLVDRSLIRSGDVTGKRRFSMLQTVREFAHDRLGLDPVWRNKVEEAHAVHYSDYTRSLGELLVGPERDETLEEMALELGNLRSAWNHWRVRGDLEQLYGLLDGLWALNDARGWYHAAMELARDMLAVLAISEDSQDRADEELALRISLARVMMAIRGYSPEVEEEFQRALQLAATSGRTANQVPVLRSLATYYILTVQNRKAAEAALRIIEIAEAEKSRSMAIEGHLLYGSSRLDNVELALEHFDQAIAMYDPADIAAGRFRLGTSPGVVARAAAAITRWRTGQLDRAVRLADDALAVARTLGHPFSLSYALYHTAYLHSLRGRFDLSLGCARELQEVAHEHDYKIWEALSHVIEGVSLAGSGEAERGVALTDTGIQIYQGLTAPPIFWPLILSLRSYAYLCDGRLGEARSLIEEAIAIVGDEIIFPEFMVQRGDVLSAEPDPPLDETISTYRAAASRARSLGVSFIEVQALSRLVAALRHRGEGAEETERLATVFESIEGGAGEHEMVAAKELLAGT